MKSDDDNKNKQRKDVSIVILLVVLLAIWASTWGTSKASAPQTSGVAESPGKQDQQAESVAAPPAPKTAWDYSASKDAMGLGEVQIARNESLNTVDFSFPYGGPQHARLYLRSHPQYGKDLYLTISRGQILTDVSDGCRVLLRFDDEKPLWVTGNGPTDHGSTTVFLSGVAPLINRMKKAKRLRIQIPVYQEGNPVFEFDIEGLQWPMKK